MELMIKTTTIVIISILSVLLIYLYPRQAINPGDLVKGHQHLDNDCFKCHSVFFGTPGEKCVACHKPADIGRVTTAGVLIDAMPGQHKAAFHHLFSAATCLTCHPDHKGMDIGKADRRFSHDMLQGINMKQCTACHKGPADNMHETNRQECSQCHTTERWRPATFDHARYFRFDKDHLADCASCHQNNNYKEYTCYGCHEHSPGKIREEHLEEGIHNYQNCVPCHPSADEDEAKRIFGSERYQDRSWNGFDGEEGNKQKGYRKTGYNDYEGDDDDRHEDDDDDHDRHGRHDDD
jgi:hypothetical protein